MANTVKPVKSEDKQPKKVVPVIQVTITEGTANIAAKIDLVQRAGKQLETLIHDTAMSCLVHADKHGDITLANKLVEAIPNLARKNALRDWFQSFGKFGYSEDTGLLTFRKAAKTNQNEAGQMPFWVFKAEAKYVPFVLDAVIIQLIERAEKAQADKTRKQDVIPNAKLEALRKLVKTA